MSTWPGPDGSLPDMDLPDLIDILFKQDRYAVLPTCRNCLTKIGSAGAHGAMIATLISNAAASCWVFVALKI